MTVTRDAPGISREGPRAILSNGLAWLCLLMAPLFPLSMLLYAGILLVTAGVSHPLLFIYNALDYFGLPVALLAIVLGHLSQLAAIRLPGPPVKRRLARIGLRIGYLSLLFMVLAVAAALVVNSREQQPHETIPASHVLSNVTAYLGRRVDWRQTLSGPLQLDQEESHVYSDSRRYY